MQCLQPLRQAAAPLSASGDSVVERVPYRKESTSRKFWKPPTRERGENEVKKILFFMQRF
jgi:hypothetical protein